MDRVNNVFRELPCKTPMLTYLLSAIFIINIFITFYGMYNEFNKIGHINYRTHAPILMYYVIILGITMAFHCSPTSSLMYHPFIFLVVFSYILTIGLGGLIHLYYLLPLIKVADTDESIKFD